MIAPAAALILGRALNLMEFTPDLEVTEAIRLACPLGGDQAEIAEEAMRALCVHIGYTRLHRPDRTLDRWEYLRARTDVLLELAGAVGDHDAEHRIAAAHDASVAQASAATRANPGGAA